MKAVLRCDATQDIGFGHLSRCISLAEAFRLRGVHCTFAGLFDIAAGEQIERAGFVRMSLSGLVASAAAEQEFTAFLRVKPQTFVVLDSYLVDEGYLAERAGGACPIVLLDDFAALSAYPCDVVLNFTIGATGHAYPAGPVGLLGPQYLPARRRLVELRPASLARPRGGAVRSLLIAIGGSDPKRIAARLVAILHGSDRAYQLRVLAHGDEALANMVGDFRAGSEVLARQPDLAEHLLWADAALTGGGLIKYECAFMAVPAAAIAQNEGQNGESQSLESAGLVCNLGQFDQVDDDELAGRLDRFLSDAQARISMVERMAGAFPPDPAARAAAAILQALGHGDGS